MVTVTVIEIITVSIIMTAGRAWRVLSMSVADWRLADHAGEG